MKKQIVYTNLIPRLFSTTLDLLLLSIILTPVINFISPKVFLAVFKDFFIAQNISLSDLDAISSATKSQAFLEYVTIGKFLTYISVSFILHSIALGFYFIGFWSSKGATPGKMLMGMKIVDQETFSKPTYYQLFRRFFGYLTALFGLWYICFTKQKQALHDKIAKTVVIKS